MTSQEIARLVASVGLPWAYDHFTEDDAPGGPPFICFTYPETNNFMADGVVYASIRTLRIELYTDEKAPDLERRVAAALDAAGLSYDSDETWIESERMFMVTWSAEIFFDEGG